MTNDRDGHTPDFSDEFVHHVDANGNERIVRVESRGTVRAHIDSEPTFPKDMTEAAQVGAIRREIEKLDAALNATSGFDPETGNPLHVLAEGSVKREAFLKQRAHLIDHEIPYAQAMGRLAEAQRATLPTTADQLQAELDRRQSIKARAQAIADEREAQTEADKLLAIRRSKLGIGS